MKSTEIEEKVKTLFQNFDRENFIYDLLRAYGISKTSITRLQKGDFNLSKNEGEILYKKKLLFKETDSDQLLAIIDDLSKEENLKHNPRFVVVTNYKELVAKDTRTGKNLDIALKDLPKNFSFFLPWAGQEVYAAKNENEADRKASYRMAKLYDILVTENPEVAEDYGHNLNVFFSRLLFCFFAEDTDIFPVEGMFTNTLMQHTQKDGSDVHLFLKKLFKVLNTKDNSKEAKYLSEFPYVNGGLFKDEIVLPKFNSEARRIIEECGDLDWKEINPDIFGSMIQAVVHPGERGNLGMHYTSVPNIKKVIEPLFLNGLYEELEKAKGNAKKLRRLITRISKLKIFDPACGSGNFLIIAYKEMRKLEIEIWQEILEIEKQQSFIYSEIKLTQFYGIEIDDFAHEIAMLSLWLTEHQMNKYFEQELEMGKALPILPLKASGHITRGNATRINWEDVCPKKEEDETYLLGNPPYLGFRNWNAEQKEDMKLIFQNLGKVKRLDYIACWFIKASNYIKEGNSKFAFVSTNSICQGEQVSLLWPLIFNKDLEIFFAYQPFNWSNNAKRNAGVTVVIVGIRNKEDAGKNLYMNNIKNKVNNISPYLIPGRSVIMYQRKEPLSSFPSMVLGSSGIDGGFLMVSEEERVDFLKGNPKSEKFIKPFISGGDFLNGITRYCLWINDEDLEEAYSIDSIKDRIDKCRNYRLKGGRDAKKAADVPHRFFYRKYKDTDCIIIPRTSSGRRKYLPCDFLESGTIISNQAFVIYNSEPYLFGIISSKLHSVWMSITSGKMRNDYSYSVNLTYNTFPFPEITAKDKERINLHVFSVLEERENHPEKTMAQLYDPDKMPAGLRRAHKELDEAIERCYRLKPFENDTERLEYLFKEYEKMINKNTLMEKGKKKTTNKRK
ncbi:class I SAM-dependent DNA methyltransferase [Salegentibacter sp. T436]|uniref:class I SAM-dependent DNA methyltransferase n=1 Tax=Salegentibacter sp. T436 TaxID=1729720 RepID=UPI00094A20D2|nr:DNA methyltransferase [Salegentibacter sp. T436]APS40478.1 DNA methyltransferase [Salegentibacter sp. T436]